MELRQLKYYLKAKELLSFTEAANALFISQSTLSQQIKQLETELGTPLFNRIGRKITLTEAGNLFSSYAAQSIKKSEEGFQIIKDLKASEKGSISIGISYGLKNFFIDTLLDFTERYPNINFKIVYEASHNLLTMLQNFEVDLILSFHEQEEAENLKCLKLFDSPMVFVGAAKSKICELGEISLDEISTLPLAIATKEYNADHLINKIFASEQLFPEFKIEVNDIETAVNLVRTGKWYSILVQISVSGTDLCVVPISSKKLTRTAKIITLKEAYMPRSIQELIKILTP